MWQAAQTPVSRFSIELRVAEASREVGVLGIVQELEAHVARETVELVRIEGRLGGERDARCRGGRFSHLGIAFDREVVQAHDVENVVRQVASQVVVRKVQSNVITVTMQLTLPTRDR